MKKWMRFSLTAALCLSFGTTVLAAAPATRPLYSFDLEIVEDETEEMRESGEADAFAEEGMLVDESMTYAELPDTRLLPRLNDAADLLTEEEEAELSALLEEISERQQFDVVIAALPETNTDDIDRYAADYFDFNGFGYGEENDGCLLLMDMEERDVAINTSGFGIAAITDYGQEHLFDLILPSLGDGNYAEGFRTFASTVDELVTMAKTDEPYDLYDEPEEEEAPAVIETQEEEKRGVSPFWLFGDAAIGLGIASIPMSAQKRRLKSVNSRQGAAEYADPAGPVLTRNEDLFLGAHVTTMIIRQERNENDGARPSSQHTGHGSTVHMGSSGHMHGGSHKKF